MMEVYRITKGKYASDLSGKGAELFGGRWNSIGVPALYTSENRSLCALELLVHIQKEFLPNTYEILAIRIPEKLKKEIIPIRKKELKGGWDKLQLESYSQELGDHYFLEKKVLGIIVPSVIMQSENNIVLNPKHEYFSKVKIFEKSKFILDKRLFK